MSCGSAYAARKSSGTADLAPPGWATTPAEQPQTAAPRIRVRRTASSLRLIVVPKTVNKILNDAGFNGLNTRCLAPAPVRRAIRRARLSLRALFGECQNPLAYHVQVLIADLLEHAGMLRLALHRGHYVRGGLALVLGGDVSVCRPDFLLVNGVAREAAMFLQFSLCPLCIDFRHDDGLK